MRKGRYAELLRRKVLGSTTPNGKRCSRCCWFLAAPTVPRMMRRYVLSVRWWNGSREDRRDDDICSIEHMLPPHSAAINPPIIVPDHFENCHNSHDRLAQCRDHRRWLRRAVRRQVIE